ncbi:MAG: DMT family transporter [Chloroflexi bacterium]|nr:DMT family transporter [Chloroflexota bacterium]
MTDPPVPLARLPIVPLLAALLAVDSLHFIFARMLLPHVSPRISALVVLAVATLEIGLFGLVTRRLHLRVLRERLGFFLSVGLLVAFSTNINYEAVAFIDPASATLLAQTGTLWGLGLGVFWLRERLTPGQIAGAGLAIVGVFVMTYQAGDYLRLGSLLVLTSAFLYALHAAVAKRGGSGIDFVDFFFFRVMMTTAFLAAFSAARGGLAWPGAAAWPVLILAGTTDVVISRGLYYLALRRMPLSLHTVALTLSPIATILWALALFDTLPAPRQLAGGGLVLAGVLLISLARTRAQSPEPARRSA